MRNTQRYEHDQNMDEVGNKWQSKSCHLWATKKKGVNGPQGSIIPLKAHHHTVPLLKALLTFQVDPGNQASKTHVFGGAAQDLNYIYPSSTYLSV